MNAVQLLSAYEAIGILRRNLAVEQEKMMLAAGWKKETIEETRHPKRHYRTPNTRWIDPVSGKRKGRADAFVVFRSRLARTEVCLGCGLDALGLPSKGKHKFRRSK